MQRHLCDAFDLGCPTFLYDLFLTSGVSGFALYTIMITELTELP